MTTRECLSSSQGYYYICIWKSGIYKYSINRQKRLLFPYLMIREYSQRIKLSLNVNSPNIFLNKCENFRVVENGKIIFRLIFICS